MLGPGTGLGTAAIVADDPPRIVASEAGHMTFGSAEEISRSIERRGPRALGSRVVGAGSQRGRGRLAARGRVRPLQFEPEDIAAAARTADPQAVRTVRLFSRLLGEFAGDVCLAFQATEGIYLCGGVLRGLLPSFDTKAFLAAFADKGRFSDSLRRVPVYFAAAHELGLQGAAHFLAGRCRMPSMEWHA